MAQPAEAKPDYAMLIKNVMSNITSWLKVAVGLVLAVVLCAQFAAMWGHTSSYLPTFKGSLQEIGIFAACITYWLKS
jgi:hypothetical protein